MVLLLLRETIVPLIPIVLAHCLILHRYVLLFIVVLCQQTLESLKKLKVCVMTISVSQSP